MVNFLKWIGTLYLLFFSIFSNAQQTTGSIQGYILDNNGAPIEFANIRMVDRATNAVSGGVSQSNGFYSIQNLTPSFYNIEVSFVGYTSNSKNNIKISLGKNINLDFELVDNLTLGEVEVIASAQADKNGNENHISNQQVEETPTLFRSIQELTRALPENNLNSFGGASHRFNNLNIDGVATNDVIGFQEPASGAAGSQANGTPGSLAKTQPIGLGAIKELSVKLSPFDVSIGNFNGASIDIITKNGTNDFTHSVFAYGNNQATLGNYVEGVKQDDVNFYDYQLGVNSGGPIKRNKVFYFTNVEYAKSNTPLINAPGSAGSNISRENIDLIRNHLVDNYNYDPGAFETADIETSSKKVFARLDFLLNEKHKLTIRHNYVNSFTDNLEWNANFFNFGNQGFRHKSIANSTTAELKSNFKNIFNNLNIGFNSVNEGRSSEGRIFPHLQIATSSSSRVFAGTYREASVFNTKFKTLQISDKLTYINGSHTLSAGLQAQINDVDYGFLSAWNGRWEYKSVEDFLNDKPSRVRGVYNINPANNDFDYVQNNPSGTVGVLESALYFQDKYSVNNNFDMSVGVRFDGQFLTQKLPVSDLISSSENFNQFDNRLRNNIQVNPRFGFNYRLPKNNLTLRGGTGLFSGKLPYLWFGYIEYISGTEYLNIDIKPAESLPIEEDLGALQAVQPEITEVNLLDPDFKFLRDWKTNFGIDWTPIEKWKFGLEATYTKTIQGLLFKTLNRNEILSNYSGADDRVFYNTSGDNVKVNQNFTNVFLLSNTNKGFRYNISLNATRKSDHWYSYLGYSYGLSKDVSSTVRSSPAANYEWNQALFGNDPELSFSNYDLRHKVIFVQSLKYNLGKKSDFLVSLLYNGRSGSPFSFVYQGDLNRDGSSRNDLLFVPNDQSEINLIDISDADGNVITASEQWNNLDAYIKNNNYLDENRSGYVERNGAKTPWNHQLDMKIEFGRLLLKENKISISLDIFNVLNLVNKNWGNLVFVPNVVNSSVSVLKFEGVENNTPQYSFNLPSDQKPWIVDTFNSRWRIQLGVKYDF